MYTAEQEAPVLREPILRAYVDDAVTLPLPPRLLAAIAVDDAWLARVGALAVPDAGERTAARIHLGATHDVWLIRWAPGSGTEMHDHGGSAGALYVAAGTLVEHRPARGGTARPSRRRLTTFEYRAMRPAHVHAVVNDSDIPATSVHVYSPPLTSMQHYQVAEGLRVTQREVVDLDTLNHSGIPRLGEQQFGTNG